MRLFVCRSISSNCRASSQRRRERFIEGTRRAGGCLFHARPDISSTAHKVELVVARYQEDLAWLKRVPASVRVTVYDKSGDPAAAPLPNIGREAHSYLHHLVSRYDTLAEATVFCQGRPFDHVPDFHRRLRRLVKQAEGCDPFSWWGFVVDYDTPTGDRLFVNWSKNEEGRPLDLDGFWRALWDRPAPAKVPFFLGAHFEVTRSCVRGQAKAFYERALDLSSRFPDAAHCFERSWARVFGQRGVTRMFDLESMPVYLRPVRKLGMTWDDIPARYRPWAR